MVCYGEGDPVGGVGGVVHEVQDRGSSGEFHPDQHHMRLGSLGSMLADIKPVQRLTPWRNYNGRKMSWMLAGFPQAGSTDDIHESVASKLLMLRSVCWHSVIVVDK